MQVVAEFTIEPFVEGHPDAHVHAGLDAVRALGLEPEIDAFGSLVRGDIELVSTAVAALLRDATLAGASQISLQVRTVAPS